MLGILYGLSVDDVQVESYRVLLSDSIAVYLRDNSCT